MFRVDIGHVGHCPMPCKIFFIKSNISEIQKWVKFLRESMYDDGMKIKMVKSKKCISHRSAGK